MKRFYWIFLISFIVVSASVILISQLTKKPETEITPTANATQLPIFFLMEQDQVFNPMLPFKTKMDLFAVDETTAMYVQDGLIELYTDKQDIVSTKYTIYDDMREEVVLNQGIKDADIIEFKTGFKMTIKLEGLPEMEDYLLMITTNYNGYNLQFYQTFSIGPSQQVDILRDAVQAHEAMMDQDSTYKNMFEPTEVGTGGTFYEADIYSEDSILMWEGLKDSVRMNDLIPKLIDYNRENGTFSVQLDFIIANRVNDDFEYWDFEEIYSGVITPQGIIFNDFKRSGSRKNEPYFDQEALKWVLDEGFVKNVTQSIASETSYYCAFAYENEIWLLDTVNNNLTKVFGYDEVDRDYILDENNENGVKLLEVDDQGNVSYLVYGYLPTGKLRGNNGILHNVYTQSGNENMTNAFIELPYDYNYLQNSFQDHGYYQADLQKYFFIMNRHVYRLDLMQNTCDYLVEVPPYSELSPEGFLYSVDSLGKDNMGLKVFNLTTEKLEAQTLYAEDMYVKPLNVVNGQLLIGLYNVKKTMETLNQEVVYPYEIICLVSEKGEVLEQYRPAQGEFFTEIILDYENKVIIASEDKLVKALNEDPAQSKVTFEKVGDQELRKLDFVKPSPIMSTIDMKNQRTRLVLNNEIQTNNLLAVIAATGISQTENIPIRVQDTQEVFEIYVGHQLMGSSIRLDEILPLGIGQENIVIIEKSKDTRKIIFDSNKRLTATDGVIQVPLMTQSTELPRGSGVTALAMFLSYNLQRSIEPSALASEIIKDTTTYRTTSGMISFGDMHQGFVGSINQLAKQGLGVYMEPLTDLAMEYMEKDLYDLTGCSFEQLLYNVSEGNPVLVITPNHFAKVTEPMRQEWSTPSGFMEVTPNLHTVVLVGYDQKNIYFNDPSTGALGSQSMGSFQLGWEDLGRQAIVVSPNR